MQASACNAEDLQRLSFAGNHLWVGGVRGFEVEAAALSEVFDCEILVPDCDNDMTRFRAYSAVYKYIVLIMQSGQHHRVTGDSEVKRRLGMRNQ
ncbi:hypothetical protein P353_08135 [Comamonas testosteroni]|uniref:Uncharacterized protein n=1 Tax=Comamonas testosteroni TaxID=285 RepID=A0A096FLN0_COMTE|nr:hypothetical protein P353_08135 [Comamonas testosteroni]